MRGAVLFSVMFGNFFIINQAVISRSDCTIDTHRKHNTQTQHQRWSSQEKKIKEEGKKETYKNKPKTIKKTDIGIHISIITLNVNGLNVPIKRHRLAGWIQTPIYAVYRRPTSDVGIYTD